MCFKTEIYFAHRGNNSYLGSSKRFAKLNMKNYNNKIGAMVVGSAVVLSMLGGASSAFAADENSVNGGHESGIIAALVAKFNLNKSDVESVFKGFHESERTQMEARMNDNMKERLAGAVVVGKITQAQSDAITAEMANVKSQMDVLKNNGKTRAENQAGMKAIMDAAKTWATQNNIPAQYMGVIDGMHGREMGGGMRSGMHGKGFGRRG